MSVFTKICQKNENITTTTTNTITNNNNHHMTGKELRRL
jgi:hypothetical protein